MKSPNNSFVARTVAAALFATLAFGPSVAGPGARLEGLVVGPDGRPAAGTRVHLIGDEGDVRASSVPGNGGLYSFRDLPAGQYALGVENAASGVAPVAGPGVRLREGELARRDIRLRDATLEERQQAASGHYGLGMWWTGLTTAGKVWTVVGVLTVAAISYIAVTSEDDQASPFEPAR